MFLTVDPSNGVAIYEQVVRQVTFAVASEVLRPTDLVPSVRELAKQLAINPNTVARAYRELQTVQVLHPVRGTGLMVAPGATELCRSQRRELVRSRLHLVLAEARQSRLSIDEIRTIVDEELAASAPKED